MDSASSRQKEEEIPTQREMALCPRCVKGQSWLQFPFLAGAGALSPVVVRAPTGRDTSCLGSQCTTLPTSPSSAASPLKLLHADPSSFLSLLYRQNSGSSWPSVPSSSVQKGASSRVAQLPQNCLRPGSNWNPRLPSSG